MPMLKTRDATELYVKIWGEGRPVILMHGWPLSSSSWDALERSAFRWTHSRRS
jgi:non-heme chloroperoxidase